MAVRAAAAGPGATPRGPSGELLHAGVGLLVLLVAAVLAVYKPRGMTPYGWRKQRQHRVKQRE